MPLVRSHKQLRVYQAGFEAAMAIFECSKRWPATERYALTNQIWRSSRGVCGNVAEAWRKRRYEAAFVSKLSDADAEAAETQVWLDFALKCGYLESTSHGQLYAGYDAICGGLVKMMADPGVWCGPSALREVPAEYSALTDNQEDAASE